MTKTLLENNMFRTQMMHLRQQMLVVISERSAPGLLQMGVGCRGSWKTLNMQRKENISARCCGTETPVRLSTRDGRKGCRG